MTTEKKSNFFKVIYHQKNDILSLLFIYIYLGNNGFLFIQRVLIITGTFPNRVKPRAIGVVMKYFDLTFLVEDVTGII